MCGTAQRWVQAFFFIPLVKAERRGVRRRSVIEIITQSRRVSDERCRHEPTRLEVNTAARLHILKTGPNRLRDRRAHRERSIINFFVHA